MDRAPSTTSHPCTCLGRADHANQSRRLHPLPPSLTIAGSRRPTYEVCVIVGAAVAIESTLVLAVLSGSSPLLLAGCLASAVAAALLLAVCTGRILSREMFTFHHYQLTCLAAAMVLPIFTGISPLPTLDLVAVALALTLAIGRIGCFAVGCCYGRPVTVAGPPKWAVVYRTEHAAAGFPCRLVGVPLIPVQLMDSALMFILSVVMILLVSTGFTAGGALVAYLAGYSVFRFALERIRGDRRRDVAGLSEAQLVALATLASTTLLIVAGLLPGGVAVSTALAATTTVLAGIALGDRRRMRHAGGLLDGEHAVEIAALLRVITHRRRQRPETTEDRQTGKRSSRPTPPGPGWTIAISRSDPPAAQSRLAGNANRRALSTGDRHSDASSSVRITTTSRGLRISGESIEVEGGSANLWSFSTHGPPHGPAPLDQLEAGWLADLLLRLSGVEANRTAVEDTTEPGTASPSGDGAKAHLIAGEHGVWHLLAPEGLLSEATS